MSTLSTPVALAACVAALFGATTAFADDEKSTPPPAPTPDSPQPQTVEPVQPTPQQPPVSTRTPPPVSTTETTAAPYPYAYAPPSRGRYAEHVVERRPNTELLSTGTSLFIISYGASVVAGAVSGREEDKRLFIPVAGPWMDLAQRDCRERECGLNEDIARAMIVTSGSVQGGSALMVLGSLVIPETVTVEERLSSAKVKVLPVSFGAGAGVGAVGRF
jgi:hypothetical protein